MLFIHIFGGNVSSDDSSWLQWMHVLAMRMRRRYVHPLKEKRKVF
jgi:hypothetical protein